MAWEPAEKVQKNDAGEFRAMIGGEWVPVKAAQKSESGEYRVDRGESVKTPAIDQGILKNIFMGALKGASDIGSTVLWPIDKATDLIQGDRKLTLSNLITGQKPISRNEERRASIGQFFNENANPESYAFRGGELGADIAGTAGIGGLLAKGATVAGAAPKIVSALESGGFRLGAPGGNILANTGTRIGAGAVTGGAQAGLVNPEYAGTGVIVGGALPVVGALAGEAGRAVKAGLYDPIVNQQQLIAKALLRSVGQDNAQTVAANLGRQAATPGVRLSAAEASGDAALAAIEDSLKASNAGGSLNRQALVNRTKLADALRSTMGDEGERAFYELSRGTAAEKLYKEAYAAGVDLSRDAVTGQFLTKSAQSARRGEITKLMQTPAMQQAAEKARGQMLNDVNLRNKALTPDGSVEGLDYTRRALSDMIGDAKPGSNEQRILLNLRGRLDTTLETISPKYAEARVTFSEMSKPINQMDIGKALTEKLIPSTSGDIPVSLNAANLATALRAPDQIARNATEFKGAIFDKIMTPEQQALIRGVSSDASRIAEMNKLGAGYGSPTARRLGTSEFIGQNFAEQAPVVSRAFEILGNVPGINYATRGLSSAGNMVGKGINTKMAAQLEEMLAADPAATRKLLVQALQQSQKQATPLNQTLESLLRVAPAALINRANP